MNFFAKAIFFRSTSRISQRPFSRLPQLTKSLTLLLLSLKSLLLLFLKRKLIIKKDCNTLVHITSGNGKIGQDGFEKEGAFSFLSLSIFFAQKSKGQGIFMKRYTLACSFQPSSCRHAFHSYLLCSECRRGKFIQE